MKRTVASLALLLVAALAGWGVSELLYRSSTAQEAIARVFRPNESMQVASNLRKVVGNEAVPSAEVDREVELLRHQFPDEPGFLRTLASSHLSLGELRDLVAEQLRTQRWIEGQIAPHVGTSEEERRAYFARHPEQFLEPPRYRVSHLFLAAPTGTADEVVAVKRSEIQALSVRLIAGEKLAAVVAEASEDEATKTRGGDLGYFAESRMPPEFIEELKKLHLGETSGPIRSHLGFHLVQLTDSQPAHELSFDQAQSEISVALANEKRAAAVAQLKQRLQANL